MSKVRELLMSILVSRERTLLSVTITLAPELLLHSSGAFTECCLLVCFGFVITDHES